MKDKLRDDAMAEVYRNDPAYALELLSSILKDGDENEFVFALCKVSKAFNTVNTSETTNQN
jgi:DNA-binding phage protein